MDKRAQLVTAPDGRRLTVAEWGDPAGWPVFFRHGTPGSRFSRHPDENLIRSARVRMITYDRPGYGSSGRHPGRTVAACADDVAAIGDGLGISRFAVAGGSGGGPHALAVPALLGHLVSRAACVSGVAPYLALGDAFFAGMDPQNVTEFGWALRGEAPLTAGLQKRPARPVPAARPGRLPPGRSAGTGPAGRAGT